MLKTPPQRFLGKIKTSVVSNGLTKFSPQDTNTEQFSTTETWHIQAEKYPGYMFPMDEDVSLLGDATSQDQKDPSQLVEDHLLCPE